MGKYSAHYKGHDRNARKAILKMGLVTKEELVYMGDTEVERKINESDFLVFESGDDFVILPKEFEDKLIWICR